MNPLTLDIQNDPPRPEPEAATSDRRTPEAVRTQLAHLIGPRHVPLKLAAGAVAAVIAFFALARGDYRVTAKTVLEPDIRRAVVAPFDGYIAEAPAWKASARSRSIAGA